MSKKIRSKVVRESLLDYNTLANSLRENTESAVKALLGETVRDTYAKLLSEDDDKDYEEEDVEVEDTNADATENEADNETDVEETEETEEFDDNELDNDGGIEDDDAEDDDLGMESDGEGDQKASMDISMTSTTVGDDAMDEEGDEWAEFDKYKVSDDEYDFTNAEDEEIVKVYKLMKNDDQILVHKDENGNVKIQDNEAGTEYLISLDDDSSALSTTIDGGVSDIDDADDFGAEGDELDNNTEEDMNESTERLFELVLEYDSKTGYTDKYQNKTAMTVNNGMKEPGKNVNDWDAGVPKGTEKPWSKLKKGVGPFNGEQGKKVEENMENECGDVEGGEDGVVTEAGHTVGGHQARRGTSITVAPNSNGRQIGLRNGSVGAERVKGTGEAAYKGTTSESFTRRANKALNENKELKGTLGNLMEQLKKVSVTNHNLAQIIKLISENTTSADEKREIINRFKSEGNTIESSKALYESISRELKKANKMSITEGKSLTVESSKKINETPIYKSKDMMESLDLMHRMM